MTDIVKTSTLSLLNFFFQLSAEIKEECNRYKRFNETKQTFFRKAIKAVGSNSVSIVAACGAAAVGTGLVVLAAPEAIIVGCVTLVAFCVIAAGVALWKFVSQSNS